MDDVPSGSTRGGRLRVATGAGTPHMKRPRRGAWRQVCGWRSGPWRPLGGLAQCSRSSGGGKWRRAGGVSCIIQKVFLFCGRPIFRYFLLLFPRSSLPDRLPAICTFSFWRTALLGRRSIRGRWGTLTPDFGELGGLVSPFRPGTTRDVCGGYFRHCLQPLRTSFHARLFRERNTRTPLFNSVDVFADFSTWIPPSHSFPLQPGSARSTLAAGNPPRKMHVARVQPVLRTAVSAASRSAQTRLLTHQVVQPHNTTVMASVGAKVAKGAMWYVLESRLSITEP